jgi:YHS domain-containing protein
MATERDPVCGMMVDTESANGSLVEGGHTYYFCSESCQTRFAANPAGFTAGAATRPSGERMERHEPPRTTTGNFTAPKFGSAGSGGLEYEPLPEAHDDEDLRR